VHGKTLVSRDQDGAVLQQVDLGAAEVKGLAVDRDHQQAWVTAANRVRRFDSSGTLNLVLLAEFTTATLGWFVSGRVITIR